MRMLLLLPLILAIPAQGGPVSRTAMLRNITAKVIAPGYQDLATRARALTNAVEQLAKTPSTGAFGTEGVRVSMALAAPPLATTANSPNKRGCYPPTLASSSFVIAL